MRKRERGRDNEGEGKEEDFFSSALFSFFFSSVFFSGSSYITELSSYVPYSTSLPRSAAATRERGAELGGKFDDQYDVISGRSVVFL